MEFLLKIGIFQKWFGPRQDESRGAARERLRGALIGDRSSVAPNLLPAMEGDLEAVLLRYFSFEKRQLKLSLGEREGSMHFSVQLPVQQVHRQAHLPKEAWQKESAPGGMPKGPRRQRGPRRANSASRGQQVG